MKNRNNDDIGFEVGWDELTWIYCESGSQVRNDNGSPDMSQHGGLVREARTNWRGRRRFR